MNYDKYKINKRNFMKCRLCEGKLQFTFKKKIINKHIISYYKCDLCKSLQTEQPYWLDGLYNINNLEEVDFGSAYRLFRNQEKVFILSKLLGLKKGLDWGGGDGILCRLLRDYCLNFYTIDKFTNSTYSNHFIIKDYNSLDLITSFEVFEHLSKPKEDIDFLFSLNAKTIFISTKLYKNQNEDWDYLYPDCGTHIFFYSQNSLELIAKKYKYNVKILNNEYALFYRPIHFSKMKLFLLILLDFVDRICQSGKLLEFLHYVENIVPTFH